MGFFLCGSCHRHVKNTEGACPFCGEPTVDAKSAGNPRSNVRDRSKLLFGVAVAAVAGAASALGCSSTSTAPAPAYGGPYDAGEEFDAGPDATSVALYGGAQIDSGAQDSGGATPAYGAPLYGAPASDGGN